MARAPRVSVAHPWIYLFSKTYTFPAPGGSLDRPWRFRLRCQRAGVGGPSRCRVVEVADEKGGPGPGQASRPATPCPAP